MRRAAKVDANHGEIVEALRSVAGVSVCSLAGAAPSTYAGVFGRADEDNRPRQNVGAR